uniref:Saposin B-type domain-containing protein n=1 Tax=Timema shepardi TaxID=629360 RepID=A0A7R9FXS3_TIMSH|nr:unnamed protein product [Timema shepardi]
MITLALASALLLIGSNAFPLYEKASMMRVSMRVIASMMKSEYEGDSKYDQSEYEDDSKYDQSEYEDDSQYDDSEYEADSKYDESEYEGDSKYDQSEYEDDSQYDESEYEDDSQYDESEYEGEGRYDESEYEGEGKYDESEYEGDSKYDESEYEGDSKYDQSEYEGDSKYDESEYEGDSKYDESEYEDEFQELPQELIKSRTIRAETPRLHQPKRRDSSKIESRGRGFFDLQPQYLEVGCPSCSPLVAGVLEAYKEAKDPQPARDMVVNLCLQFNDETKDVCTGVVDMFLETIVYLADRVDSANITQRICGLIFNSGDCLFQDDWTVDVELGAKPRAVTPNAIPDNNHTVTIVQLTDLHHDPKYTSGGNAVCGEPTCCRSTQGAPADVSKAAGYWGDYRDCDLPLKTIKDTFRHIKQKHKKIDYVYFTGDIVHHGIWETSQKSNAKIITHIVRELNKTFGNIPVIYALGNHETWPIDAYAPLDVDNANISSKWLFELVADIWPDYLTKEARETILNGGFYTVKLRDGFRVIVLNNNVCYNLNIKAELNWLVYQSKDPYGQLKWLAETLLQAEKDGEKVHILQHIPTGSKDCVEVWSREYHKIVDRLDNILYFFTNLNISKTYSQLTIKKHFDHLAYMETELYLTASAYTETELYLTASAYTETELYLTTSAYTETELYLTASAYTETELYLTVSAYTETELYLTASAYTETELYLTASAYTETELYLTASAYTETELYLTASAYTETELCLTASAYTETELYLTASAYTKTELYLTASAYTETALPHRFSLHGNRALPHRFSLHGNRALPHRFSLHGNRALPHRFSLHGNRASVIYLCMFEHTITAQFNGHTHKDEFQIFYSLDNTTRANNVAFNGGSGTTYSDVNTNYKVYTVDPSTWYALDSESWVFNLTEANLSPDHSPDWFKLYSFRQEYGVKNLLPAQLDSLAHRMAANHTLIQQYQRFSVKNGDPSLQNSCGDDCLRNSLCDIVTARSGDTTQCDSFKTEFDAASASKKEKDVAKTIRSAPTSKPTPAKYFSSHPPVYEKYTKIFVWNCALHSAGDVVFDCFAHVHIGGAWGERRDCQVERAPLLSQCRLWRKTLTMALHPQEICSVTVTKEVGSEPAFAWRESGKPFRKNLPPVHATEIRTSIYPSSAVERLNTTSTLANYATEAGYKRVLRSQGYLSCDHDVPTDGGLWLHSSDLWLCVSSGYQSGNTVYGGLPVMRAGFESLSAVANVFPPPPPKLFPSLPSASYYLFGKKKARMITGALFPAQGISPHEDSEELHQELTKQRLSGVTTPRLQQLVAQYSIPTELHGVEFKDFPQPYITATCALCKPLVKEVLAVYNKGKDAQETGDRVITLCVLFNVETREVCTGLVNVYLESALYLAEHVNNDTLIDGVCGLVINSDECHFQDEWTVDVDLGTKPDVVTPAISDSPTVTVVQVTDIHYDPKYTFGGNAVCGEPTCCRSAQGSPADESSAAGYWGDYRDCDMPLQTVTDMLTHIKQTHQKIDYVYFTGDIIDHGVWETSQEFNTRIIKEVVQEFNDFFGEIPVIFTLGNHEPTPVNIKWLFELVADIWPDYLTQEARETILNGGFYTVKLRDGFRVIVLNNIVCYNSNVWLVYESKDPYGQLKWLAETLLQAEKDGEKVHILQHIPTGSKDCVEVWSREYHKIVDSWVFNLTEANLSPDHSPDWFKLYSFRQEYGVKNLLPAQLDSLAHRMAANHTLIQQYAPLDVNTNVSTKWLFELVSELWSPYITEDAKQTILQGGFYTVKPRHGFRVIVLNNIVCLNNNYWLAYDSRDPYNQLKWLAETLLLSEREGDKVHILYHVPSGMNNQWGSCLKIWGREFHKIVDRFENIVAAHFTGHTHYDEFHVFYSTENATRANGVSFNGGSGTPFIDVNPNYKIYTNVVDSDMWIFNLTDANSKPDQDPDWFKLYSFRDEYGVANLLPAQLDSLAHRMAANHTLLQEYYSTPRVPIPTVESRYAVARTALRLKQKTTARAIGATTSNIDYVYMTGDIVDHAIWQTSPESNSKVITQVTKLFQKVFPKTPVYFALGNHEPSPINLFPPQEVWSNNLTVEWLYKLSADLWSHWLPQNSLSTIESGGYYTTLVRKNFRIVVLNICCRRSWLLYNSRDPGGQLAWLVKVLSKAEKKKEKVHILGHIYPGGEDCQHVWSREFRKIMDRRSIDYVYMTGDFVDHGVWETSQENNTKTITAVVNAVKETFGDVPIIFTLGNHEPTPVNQYAPLYVDDDVSSKWLYELVAELWSPYITDEAKQTILQGGFYTLLLQPGFRVIILNNVVGYKSNFWMALGSEDPYGQLKWLAETLLQAEQDGEKVHLLYHIQMQSCLPTWSREYHKIIDRFENTITAQFNGHTHTDEFQVFHSVSDLTRANSVLFNGESGTANANVNPNYRIYTVDPNSLYVLDAETWIYNLTDANLSPKINPKWFLEYSMREAFGVSTLLPQALSSLTHSMARDHALMRQYYR